MPVSTRDRMVTVVDGAWLLLRATGRHPDYVVCHRQLVRERGSHCATGVGNAAAGHGRLRADQQAIHISDLRLRAWRT